MRRREDYGHRRNDREHREHPKTQTVNNKRGKLPVVAFIRDFLVRFHFVRQHFQLLEYILELVRRSARREIRHGHAAIFYRHAIAVRFRAAEVIVKVKDVGKETARGPARHLVVGRPRLGRTFSITDVAAARSFHTQKPRQPLTYELLHL